MKMKRLWGQKLTCGAIIMTYDKGQFGKRERRRRIAGCPTYAKGRLGTVENF